MKITEYKQVWDLWNKSQEKLHAYVLSRFKNKELAEEVTQEVLLKIHKSCCSQKEIGNLNSWLFQIAHNTSLDIIKKNEKQKEVVEINESPENSETFEELSAFLEPLIGFLPKKYAIPLRMADLEGIPQKDIAFKMGLGLSATKSRIQRARELLKQEIKVCYHLEIDKNGIPVHVELKDTCNTLKELKK
ncbi:MAG: sigma-70 family RNA polymerase sigma factor [Gillisia sp.]